MDTLDQHVGHNLSVVRFTNGKEIVGLVCNTCNLPIAHQSPQLLTPPNLTYLVHNTYTRGLYAVSAVSAEEAQIVMCNRGAWSDSESPPFYLLDEVSNEEEDTPFTHIDDAREFLDTLQTSDCHEDLQVLKSSLYGRTFTAVVGDETGVILYSNRPGYNQVYAQLFFVIVEFGKAKLFTVDESGNKIAIGSDHIYGPDVTVFYSKDYSSAVNLIF